MEGDTPVDAIAGVSGTSGDRASALPADNDGEGLVGPPDEEGTTVDSWLTLSTAYMHRATTALG